MEQDLNLRRREPTVLQTASFEPDLDIHPEKTDKRTIQKNGRTTGIRTQTGGFGDRNATVTNMILWCLEQRSNLRPAGFNRVLYQLSYPGMG